MSLASFQYPIVDSGYFFDFELLEVSKETASEHVSLKIRYSLRNVHPVKFQIPISILRIAYPDCSQEISPGSYKGQSIYCDHVVDLQNNKKMYGYGDDHHVLFEPGERKEFLIVFKPSETDFATFDTNFFMKPDDDDYGLYMLRYDFQSGRVIKRYCIKKYPGREPKKLVVFSWSDAWLLLSIAMGDDGNGASLESIIAVGDWINHAIFTGAELRGGLAKLLHVACITESEGRFSLSGEAKTHWAVCKETYKNPLDRMKDLEVFLGVTPQPSPDAASEDAEWHYPGVTDEMVNQAYQAYIGKNRAMKKP